MKNLLIIRFSAIGDVAMTIPVITSLAVDNPSLRITVLSRSFLQPLFGHMPPNVRFKGVDLKADAYKGIRGLCRLFTELKQENFDAVADFHNVLRSKFLCLLFRLAGKRVACIDKGRKGKRLLVKAEGKVRVQQKTSFQRYADVLTRLGLQSRSSFQSIFYPQKGDLDLIVDITGPKAENHWIGIAPFAAHPGKIYPLEKLDKVIGMLAAEPHLRLFIFGAGDSQRQVAERWMSRYPDKVLSVIGKMTLDKELVLMSWLDVMLSMDSSNMHLASLVHTPVVSVWGATHPYAGFMGWRQRTEDAVQLDLPCRPCSVYGNKPCLRGDYACLNDIAPERVVTQLKSHLPQVKYGE